MIKSRLLLALSICVPFFLLAQVKTNQAVLRQAHLQLQQDHLQNYQHLVATARQKNWPLSFSGGNGAQALLVGIDVAGYPLYLTTFNVAAAATIRTTTLWPGGSTGLNLTGSSAGVRGKMAIWDGGGVRGSHVELTNRILQKDNPSTQSDHATHVAGTMIAAGVNPAARGMAYGMQQMLAYDFTSDVSEMFGEAANLLVSNHSYATIAGWYYNNTQSRWEFYGEAGATQDFKFGYYSNKAQMYDSIAFNAPYYLIVSAAGNSRNTNGPAVGQPYFRFDANGNMNSAGNRPDGIYSNDGYDIIPGEANAKNILTVGAIGPLVSGYSRAEDVAITSFSGWGPTDDGRIKPDVVANGSGVFSSTAAGDNTYSSLSGTSMATPSITGSLLLLQEHYSKQNSGNFMRAATLKGLVIHTADEAGPAPGPDYQYGFGLANMQKAASVITSPATEHLVQENNLNNGATYTLQVTASGKGPLTATISWTDPKGTVETVNRLNNTTKKLVNDLDIVVRKGSTVFMPYILNPAMPSAVATTGDNTTDNVEKIVVADAIPGETYTIEVKHKGTLQRGTQAYSLLVSGIGGKAYCTSAATNTAGARIDSVGIGLASIATPPLCRTYTNYTDRTIGVEPNQAINLAVKVSSCDASNANKVIKAFIDWNSDGDFDDAGETIAQSGVIAANGVFATTFTTPQQLAIGNFTIMRIIVQETATATDVLACGSYGRGETQDFRVRIAPPSTDLGISEILAPAAVGCGNPEQHITVRVKNYGVSNHSNVPLTLVVRNGNTVVGNLTATYPISLTAFSEGIYTFQTPVNMPAGTYTVVASTALGTDQNAANNTLEKMVVLTTPDAPVATGRICTDTDIKLVANNTGSDVHFWYTTPTGNAPFTMGDRVTTSTLTANKTYYVAKNLRTSVGPANKLAFSGGGYNAFSGNYVNISNDVPVVIESARLYVGNPGKINVILADIISTEANGSFTYRPLASRLINAYATTPNPMAGVVNGNNAADTGAVYYLNLPVNTIGNHVLIVQCSEGATIFRNNGITSSPYPFSIPGVFSITGNSATQAGDPNFFQGFYYFFYDMKVSTTAGCPSPRVPVVATNAIAPTLTLNGMVLTASTTSGNQWYHNNNVIPGVTGATYTATEPGTYKVVNVDGFGCLTTSNEVNVVVTAVVDVDGTEIGLKVSPNPSNGRFMVQFDVTGRADLNISLVSATGQRVFTNTYPGFSGQFNKQLNVGRPASGVYTLRIDHNKKVYVKKVMIY